jgi:hypothetical protein
MGKRGVMHFNKPLLTKLAAVIDDRTKVLLK